MMRVVCLILTALLVSTHAFTVGKRSCATLAPSSHHFQALATTSTALFDKRDASRSGTKRERLDRLAELEDSRVETDKSFVLKAAGGFVAIIVVGVIAAFAIQGPPI